MGANRDDFSETAKGVIARRACYVCCNPDCRRFTAQAHSDPEKALTTGVASHIRAAAEGGPRFDPSQTEAERRSARNGIWLCHSCSDLVDKDQVRFTAAVLTGWRTEHEHWIEGQGLLAKLPDISFATSAGLTVPAAGGQLTGEHFRLLREQHLVIKNPGTRRIEGLAAYLQLPERAQIVRIEAPAGMAVDLRADRMEFQAVVIGGGSVEAPDVRDLPFPNFRLSVDRILPTDELRITMLSFPREPADLPSLPAGLKRAANLSHYIEGTFVCEANHLYVRRSFLVAISFDKAVRRATSTPCEDDDGTKPRWREMISW
jgi:hypothetical protein